VRRVRGRTRAVRIVEVEAYLGAADPAAHVFRGPTPRTAPLFGPPGTLYVYLVYGMHHCLNIVTGEAGHPAAVLLRAAESPGTSSASGPGRLTRAFRVDGALDGASFVTGPLWLEAGEPVRTGSIRRTPRIGVGYAGPWASRPYRFIVAGHPDVSGPRALRK
jgi:DNA-3-methyladenine glycosylase